MIKIMLVFGTRPEAIKMAPLVHEFLKHPTKFETLVCVTAQHRQMLDPVLELFDIYPDIDLDLMKHGQDLFDITSSILLSMREVYTKHQPNLVLVHGDTTTAFASSLASFYLNIPVGHIEAGLRTNNIVSPFPEEFNRQIITKISHYDFAPTDISGKNLLAESKNKNNILISGNTVIDALFWIINKINSDKILKNTIVNHLTAQLNFDWQNTKYVLITGHRRENFGQGFQNICIAIASLAKKYSDIHFIYPVHLNPNVQKPVKDTLNDLSNIHLIDPLDYQFFVYLLEHSYLVLTDSGGIQEEAPSLGKPVLVMRDLTERPEAVEAGTVKLIGTDKENIIKNVSELIDNKNKYNEMAFAHNPYGDGNASKKIIEGIIDTFKL